MTFLLVFLAIAVLGLAAVFGIGRLRPGSAGSAGTVPATVQGLPEPDPRLPPVLLPEHPAAGDVPRLRFSVALRGYRMDQVDTVLDRFAQALEERDARIRTLEAAGRGDLPDGDGK